jgi:serine/threonine protein kinase
MVFSAGAVFYYMLTGRKPFAAPDLPEVYFLSGLENPTRSFFEGYDYPLSSPRDVLKQIDEHRITAIVINHSPQFSFPLPPELEDSLVRRFPETKRFGSLEVRWQELPK